MAWGIIIGSLAILIYDVATYFLRRSKPVEDRDFPLIEKSIEKWLGIRKTINNLPALLESYRKNQLPATAMGDIGNLFKEFEEEEFKKEFFTMLRKLDYSFYTDFWEFLESMGIEVSPATIDEKEVFIIRIKEETARRVFWREIPDNHGDGLRSIIESSFLHQYEQHKQAELKEVMEEAMI